jgi:hypothetical protein
MLDIERLKQRLLRQGVEESALKKRDLTYKEWHEMSSDEQDWHTLINPEAVDRALNSRAAEKQQEQENERNAEAYDARRFHENQYTKEETEQAITEISKFCGAYPQFKGAVIANRKTLLAKLKTMNALPVFSSIVAAYEACVLDGSISVNPSIIGAGPETNLSGDALKNHVNIHKILARGDKQIVRPEIKADDFLKEHPELVRNEEAEVGFMARHYEKIRIDLKGLRPEWAETAGNARILNAWLKNHSLAFTLTNVLAAFDACKNRLELAPVIASAGGMQVVDYEPAPQRDLGKLKKKVMGASAAAYLDFITNDLAAREAIDNG